ncbi:methionyl-tRNA ligase [Sphingomonas sp. MM-1]|uniref:methionine--tRNA ligase n=1 Tax=Sphingomonas sp. MM-1 TaxID=745310 RepID=UPI0002C0E5E7|nr:MULTISPECIES: methionine--tRNA ligase [unclassified Sphingomonas]AGH47854.1 methionyl-tRNA ligase [Sphingomonas sp. MM-1]MDX3882889.1 methionine--tRNA ligase [Sphingomonas sp.]
MAEPFYITTAISYPNGRPHIGHAYEVIATDAIARFRRMEGRDVFFLTGTDEHGLKMDQAARARGISPRELADEMSSYFREMTGVLNISNDRFIRTSEPAHYEASQALWRAMAANGDIYPGRYEGWYSVRDEAFYDEKELVAGEDGQKLSPQGTPVEWTVEESWFFRLSAYADRLLAHYEANPDFIRPEGRRNEVVSFVKGGLSDLSISRTSFDWGVPVPDAPGHVMYVWVDALTNYLTGVGYPEDTDTYRKYWPADLHIIGKDIVRFHAVYWPAFLMSANLPLPSQVFGHGFLLNRGEKMSKSLGNVVDPMEMARTYGVDQLRYFLLREVSFGQDGSYSHDAIVTRSNADLANGLGNLAQRCLSMIAKNCGGVVPGEGAPAPVLDAAALLARVEEAMAGLAIHRALEVIWEGVAEANRYFADSAPWAVRKTDPAAADAILHATAEAIRVLAILVRWAIPESADKLLDQLAQPADARDFAALAAPIAPGTALPAPQGVFPRWVEQEG